MRKKIKIDDFRFIETNKPEIIAKAQTTGLTITNIPSNPNDYQPDDSDRPEVIARIQAEQSRKTAQDKIDNETNKPNILKALKDYPYNEKSQNQRASMTYTKLSDYYSKMITKLGLINQALELKIANAKTKTYDELILAIKNELDKRSKLI